MMDVVPPAAAADVPVKKSSDAVVPMNGSSMWVWGSMPPGMTSRPSASITRASDGASRFVPTAWTSPSTQRTSAARSSSWVTTVPPLMRTAELATRTGAAIRRDDARRATGACLRRVTSDVPASEAFADVAIISWTFRRSWGPSLFRCKGANVGLTAAQTSRLTASGVDRTESKCIRGAADARRCSEPRPKSKRPYPGFGGSRDGSTRTREPRVCERSSHRQLPEHVS